MTRRKRGSDGVPVSAERSGLAKTIGSRLKEAREVAGMTQNEAARLLGYRNSSKLAKIENGSDTNSVPLWLILRAARLYQVSIDFLFGDCPDWEIGAQAVIERDVSKWVFDYYQKSNARMMTIIKKLHHRVHDVSQMSEVMDSESLELVAALTRFIELNPSFEEEMRGGNRVVSAVTKIRNAAVESKKRLDKFHKDCRESKEKDGLPEIGVLELDFYMDRGSNGG